MKTLRNIGVIFAVLLILTSLVACGGKGDIVPDPPKGNGNEEPNPPNGNEEPKKLTVTFEMPEGWAFSEPIPDNFMTQVIHTSGANLNIQSAWRTGSNLAEYVEKTKAVLATTYSKAQWGDNRNLKIDGHDAIELNFTNPVAGFEMVLKATYLEIDGSVYGITFTCFANDADSMVPDYQTIIDTAKFE